MKRDSAFKKLFKLNGWSQWSNYDQDLYEHKMEQEICSKSYENSFGYFFQECRFDAAKHLCGETISTVYSRSRGSSLAIFLPQICGPNGGSVNLAVELCRKVHEGTGRTVLLRKCTPQFASRLVQHNDFRVFLPSEHKNPRELPEDIFPQVVIDVGESVKLSGSKFVKVRNHVKFAKREASMQFCDLSPENSASLQTAILEWTEAFNVRAKAKPSEIKTVSDEGLDPSSYTVFCNNMANLIDNKKYFSRVLSIDQKQAGFWFAGRTSENSAALYVSLCIADLRGASDTLILDAIETLSLHSVQFLNLGGSESASLFEYKRKWGAISLIESTEILYRPSQNSKL